MFDSGIFYLLPKEAEIFPAGLHDDRFRLTAVGRVCRLKTRGRPIGDIQPLRSDCKEPEVQHSQRYPNVILSVTSGLSVYQNYFLDAAPNMNPKPALINPPSAFR